MDRLLANPATFHTNRIATTARVVLILAIFIMPFGAFAECRESGYTVIFVNGVGNSLTDALNSRDVLEMYIPARLYSESVNVEVGYNATHLGGFADKVQSVTQAFSRPVSQFDLNNILIHIHPEVTTRKILLVGHSQGSFYTNELYDYLTTHGVPKESIGVYNIATPASFVAGGGRYITSTNDKVINFVRDAEKKGNQRVYANSHYTVGGVIASALRANMTVPQEAGYAENPSGGHGFSVYLDGAAPRVVKDISNILSSLKASDGDAQEGCFVPPDENLGHKMQAAVFLAADPIADAAVSLHKSFFSSMNNIGNFVLSSRGMFAPSQQQNVSQIAATVLAVDREQGEQKTVVQTPSQAPLVAATVSQQESQGPRGVTVENTTPERDTAPDSTTENVGNATAEPPPPTAIPPITLVEVQPGYGGGGGGAPTAQSASSASQSVALSVSEPADNLVSAATSVTFSGTASAGASVAIISSAASTSVAADSSGSWSATLDLAEGAYAFAIQAALSGTSSSEATRNVTVDLTAPGSSTLSISDCDASVVAGACVIPALSTSLSWSDVSDASYYGVKKDGTVLATTTATSSTQSISQDAASTFSIVSYDLAGNSATSAEMEVTGISSPLIINEIGWGGTDTEPANQWIELKNISTHDIDLSHITIARTGGDAIPLSGTIAAGGENLLVVEPNSISFTGTRILIVPFSLDTSGEQLSLTWGSEILDMTPAVDTCGGWCAGSLITSLGSSEGGRPALRSALSMERTSDESDGTSQSSWHNTDSYGRWLGVSNTAGLWGTPNFTNSSNFPDAGVYCGTFSNLLDENDSSGFSPGTGGCVYLSKFITGGSYGAIRYGGLYRGTVSSSTVVTGHHMGKDLAYSTSDTTPADAVAGEPYFFAMWEQRNGDAFWYDSKFFNIFFQEGASSTAGVTGAPHGNYVTLPFTYQP